MLSIQPKRLVVFISGNGTNLQYILDSCAAGDLFATVVLVVSSRSNVHGIERAESAGVPVRIITDFSSNNSNCLTVVKEKMPDLIVLAGFMKILPAWYIDNFNAVGVPIINLHPALPGDLPGAKAIERAFERFQNDPMCYKSGIMVHHVVPEVDAGDVIAQKEISIYPTDSLETFQRRLQIQEKPLLLSAIQQVLGLKSGKVKNVIELGMNNLLAMVYSNRVSACDIPNLTHINTKGSILCATAAYFFKATRHIVDNHYIKHQYNIMYVRKCTVFPIEVVVRGYITGSTSTSLWTHYQKGERVYCGLTFPDGLTKNQKLPTPVITPTTKSDVHDELISAYEIIRQKIVPAETWYRIERVALQLFEFGQALAASKGLILVDTKYEFGLDSDGNLVLVDEIHTPDSSRYWRAESYQELWGQGLEPERFDKDIIRRWLATVLKENDEELPAVPPELNKKTKQAYTDFITQFGITGSFDTLLHPNQVAYMLNDYLNHSLDKIIFIINTSYCSGLKDYLERSGLPVVNYSCDNSYDKVIHVIREHDYDNCKNIYVTRCPYFANFIANQTKSLVIYVNYENITVPQFTSPVLVLNRSQFIVDLAKRLLG